MLRGTATRRFRAVDIVHNNIIMQGRGRGAARGRNGRGGRKQQHMRSTILRVVILQTKMVLVTGGDRIRDQDEVVEDIATQEMLHQINKQIITNQSTLKQQTFNQYFITNYVVLPSIKSMHHIVHVPRLLSYVNVMRVHRLESNLIMRL